MASAAEMRADDNQEGTIPINKKKEVWRKLKYAMAHYACVLHCFLIGDSNSDTHTTLLSTARSLKQQSPS